jgi:hypothetical protein
MISQSAFAAGAGAVGVGAGAVAAGAAEEVDGQGVDVADVDVADVAGTGIVVEVPAEADGAAALPAVPAAAGVAEALPPAPADVAPAAAGDGPDVADMADPAEAGVRQGFAGAAALAEASSTVLMCGVMTAAIPTPSTTARSPIISAGRARGGRSSWLR